MRKYFNIKVFFLVVAAIFMGANGHIFASQNNPPKLPKKRKTFKMGAPKNYKNKNQPPIKSTKEVIYTINERGRRNSELIESQTSTILVGQDRAHKSLQDIKDATKETTKKVVKTIKKETEKTNNKIGALAIILGILVLYAWYKDYYVVNKKIKPIKTSRFSNDEQTTYIPFLKNEPPTPCNRGGLKCWQKFILLLISLLAAVLLRRKFFNLKPK